MKRLNPLLPIASCLGRRYDQLYPDPDCGGSLWRKLWANVYRISVDWEKGVFPPVRYSHPMPYRDTSSSDPFRDNAGKPWGDPAQRQRYLKDACLLLSLMERQALRPGSTVLEVGCGGGWLTDVLSKAGYTACGCDITPELISVAIATYPRLDFFCCAAEDLPPPGKSFDAVVCYETLHHTYNWRQALCRMLASLNRGGFLFLCAEPSSLHTFLAYRSSVIRGVQEVGFSYKELANYLNADPQVASWKYRAAFPWWKPVAREGRGRLVSNAHWFVVQINP